MGQSWWVDFTYRRTRYRFRSPENSRAGAAAYELVARQRLARGEPVEQGQPARRTFRDFANEWMVAYVAANNSRSEQRNKRLALDRHLLPAFGELPLDAVSTVLVERYKAAKLEHGLGAKTVNNQLAILAKCLRTAVEWDVLARAPKVQLLKAKSMRTDFLLPEESRALLDACVEPMWRLMLLTALRTGLRLGELFGLEWRDVDFDNRILSVRQSIVRGVASVPKSGKTRYIPMTAELRDALFACRQVSGLVFHRGDGEPLSHHIAASAIQRACKSAGLRQVGWHTLRHTFASQLAAAGVPIPSIQQLLGHSTIVVTMRYAHLAPSALREAVAVLDRLGTPSAKIPRQPAGNEFAEPAVFEGRTPRSSVQIFAQATENPLTGVRGCSGCGGRI